MGQPRILCASGPAMPNLFPQCPCLIDAPQPKPLGRVCGRSSPFRLTESPGVLQKHSVTVRKPAENRPAPEFPYVTT